MSHPRLAVWSVIAAAAAAMPAFAADRITLVGTAAIPGDARDRSALAGDLLTSAGADSGIASDTFGGAGSAIDYTGENDLYLMASDRGPKNGDVQFQNRVHTVRIVVHPGDKTPVTAEVVATTLLTTASGKHYNGAAMAYPGGPGFVGSETLRLDPEGIRCVADPAGAFWISDEYGPYILKFDKAGKNIGSFPLPAKYAAPLASANEDVELFSNKTGRMPNRGMEGLALLPDGKTLVGLMQNALTQDHAMDDQYKRDSVFTRIITMSLRDSKTREYVYPFDSAKHGCNEILAINDHELLVIERDSKDGTAAKSKKIYKIDLAGATDISVPFNADGKPYDYSGTTADNGLPAKGPIAGVTPVAKSVFIDMLDPAYKLAGERFPEKQEGLAWGPDFDNGDKMLVVTVDNDFIPTTPTWFYVFRVSKALVIAAAH